MAKLIKRTTTEVFEAADDEDLIDDDEAGDEDDADVEEPQSRHPRR